MFHRLLSNTHKLLLVNNVLYLVTGRQGGILLCNWPTQYKYIEINNAQIS